MTMPRYTREVGRKFHADGTPQYFPGNTIICMLSPTHPLFQTASAFQEALGKTPVGAKFAFLPPASFHMTVMDLLCDQVRDPAHWAHALPHESTMAEADAFVYARVQPLVPPTELVMRVVGIFYGNNLMLTLKPADEATRNSLHAYRASVAAATGIRFPDHDTYGFHLSLAYRLIELTGAEEEVLTSVCHHWEPALQAAGAALVLPPPQLCRFDDMSNFVPIEGVR
ncbi:DUF1868 domain-containing protein [Candidatus Chloroploca sp. M-50]|uniref:DUF1868 domain-containing protein n=1 Tax=Candidatus Chloroploca mongolica TaxID=2528176 RepID=A0ABS4DFT6_9CHLR|nr:DUF1868 domain-containing protein [Candidatus Chloroploca mongolica]MBP1468286.1 DUF1868 domain-containing protein [Candidatus Chloroploca mongolica]